MLHTAGRYEASIESFHQAESLSEELYKSLARQSISLITNENTLPYVGERYERLLIPIWNALNYASLGEHEAALVEIRRFNVLHDAIYGRELPPEDVENPFSRYLAGTLWEANGLANDAYIDYRLTHRMAPQFPLVKGDLLDLSRRLGFKEDLKKWRTEFSHTVLRVPSAVSPAAASGELIVILEAGLSPQRYSSEWMNPEFLQVFPVPQYEPRETRTEYANLVVAGEVVGRTYSLASLTQVAMATLKAALPALTAKAVGRTVIKEGAAVAVGKTVDEELGFILGFLALATNQVDRRHWRTLPDTLQIARVSLPPGTVDLGLNLMSGDGETPVRTIAIPALEITAGGKTYVPYRVFD